MANSQHGSLDEPGKRTGEGSRSILPHLQRQVQTSIKPHPKQGPPGADQPDVPDSEAEPEEK